MSDREIKPFMKTALVGLTRLKPIPRIFPAVCGKVRWRAIVSNPEIILYDEPTSGLDPVTSRNIDN